MSIEVRPLAVKCNVQCHYCYQNQQRDAGSRASNLDGAKSENAYLHRGPATRARE